MGVIKIYYCEAFVREDSQVKIVKIRLIFVKNLANSWLLAKFFAAVRQIFPYFTLVPLCAKVSLLKMNVCRILPAPFT